MEKKFTFHRGFFEYLQDELEGGNHFLEVLRLTSKSGISFHFIPNLLPPRSEVKRSPKYSAFPAALIERTTETLRTKLG